jgi:hypothetical protein
MKFLHLSLAGACALPMFGAHAGRPLATEDAAVFERGVWVRFAVTDKLNFDASQAELQHTARRNPP